MQEIDDETEEGGAEEHSDAAPPERTKPFIAVVIAVAAFATAMLLMLLAVGRRPAAVTPNSGTGSGNVAPAEHAREVSIESYVQNVRANAAGARELEIKGYVKNAGKMAVNSADLKCYFRTHSGGEASLEIPLVIDSRLDDLDGGPLMPLSGREFHVRAGEFPDGLEPEMLRLEVVNVSVLGR
jgi:hypothetical protein